MEHTRSIAAIVACTDMAASVAFYRRLGLTPQSDYGTYCILSDGRGLDLHLTTESPAEWVVPGCNPNGLYIYAPDVDALTEGVRDIMIGGGPEHKHWGMYEFAVSDPSGMLVRIGWPSRLMTA